MSVYFESSKALAATFPLFSGPVSFSIWFNLAGWKSGNQCVMGSEQNFTVDIDNVNFKIRNKMYKSTASAGTTILNLNEWYHYVAIANSTTGNASAYLNNSLDYTGTGHTTLPIITDMSLGNRSGETLSRSIFGTFQDCRFYNRELSTKEINAIYLGRGHDTILDYTNKWPFETQGSGQITAGRSFYDVAGKKTAIFAGVTNSSYKGGILTTRRYVG